MSQWQFPDTEAFKNNTLSCSEAHLTFEIERCAQTVLVLFRSLQKCVTFNQVVKLHIQCFGKQRDVHENDESFLMTGSSPIVFSNKHISFLKKNVQSSAHTSLGHKVGPDPLEKITNPFTPNQHHDMQSNAIKGEEDEGIIDCIV